MSRMAQDRGPTVCVIGAGVAGLVSAKVLKHNGFDVTVFEKESTVGGVWAPSRAYPGLRTNNPRETYAFSDFPHPDTSDEFPTAGQVQGYLRSYVLHFDIEPHLRLATDVVSVARRCSNGGDAHPGFQVLVRATDGSTAVQSHDFDFVVVCNGVFSNPYVPQVEDKERFRGSQMHSSDIVDPEILTGKRVVVVGAGKSALDCASAAGHRAASCTLVCRTPHWVVPRYFFGRLRVDRVLFTRLSEMLLPAYHRATRLENALRAVAAPLLWLLRRGVSGLVRRLSGMPPEMTPQSVVTSGAENIGIGEEFFEALREGLVETRRTRTLSFSDNDKVRLDTGEQIDADLVIFATGWYQSVPFLAPDLRNEIQPDGRFELFRSILPPTEWRLGFVGYASSANCPLTSEIAAHWLSRCFLAEMGLPDPADMKQEIARVRKWTAKIFPKRAEGYFIGGYVAHYLDELMRDMGLHPWQTTSFLSEYLAPLWAERYQTRLRSAASACSPKRHIDR